MHERPTAPPKLPRRLADPMLPRWSSKPPGLLLDKKLAVATPLLLAYDGVIALATIECLAIIGTKNCLFI
jgi:hypothetical protein